MSSSLFSSAAERGEAVSAAARSALAREKKRSVRFGMPCRRRVAAQTADASSSSSNVAVPAPSSGNCAASRFSSSKVRVYPPAHAESTRRKRGRVASLCLLLLLLSKLASFLFRQSPLRSRSTSSAPEAPSALEFLFPSWGVQPPLASPAAVFPAPFFSATFAYAQAFSVLEEEGEWAEEESDEEDMAEDVSEEQSENDDTGAATHRVYQHDDRYYRALPLTDAQYLLDSIRLQFPHLARSPSVWIDIEEEITRQLRLVDRRTFPQSLFESITESEALEPGALLTPLGRSELPEGEARAYEIQKTTEIIQDVLSRHLGSPAPASEAATDSASSPHAAPSRPSVSSPSSGDSSPVNGAHVPRASTPSGDASASKVSSLSAGKELQPDNSGPQAPQVHGADPSPAVSPQSPSATRQAKVPGSGVPVSAVPKETSAPRHPPGGSDPREFGRGDSLRSASGESSTASGQQRGLLRTEASGSTSLSSPAPASSPSSGVDAPSAPTEAPGEKQGPSQNQKRRKTTGELGPDEPLNLGEVAFRPSAYIDLILRVAKPAKFANDDASDRRRRKDQHSLAGTGGSPAKARTDGSGAADRSDSPLSSPPPRPSPRAVRDFGEFYVLLRGVLEYHREGLPQATSPSPEPLFPSRAETGGHDASAIWREEGGEGLGAATTSTALLEALHTELNNLSVEGVKKVQAEAYGACSFLSFFGVPDAEGKLQLPGGWPRDIRLALRCAVEGNRGRQLCGTCFLIDGLATALGFPPVVAGSDAWAIAQDVGVKSLFVMHRRPDLYMPPDLLDEGVSSRQAGTPFGPRTSSPAETGQGASPRHAKGLRSSFDAPLIKYEMAAQLGDSLGKLAAAYYLQTGLGTIDYRYKDKEEIDEPALPDELLPYRKGKVTKAQVSTERLPGNSSTGCFAALKHVLDVGRDATDASSGHVTPRYLLREHLVPSAYRHSSTQNLSSLSRVEIASADEGHAGSAGSDPATSTASEEYALLVQSLADDGSPGGLAALGDLYFHGHEAGGIARDVGRAAELWRSAAAMGDANAAMALAYLLLGDVSEAAREAKEEEDDSEKSGKKDDSEKSGKEQVRTSVSAASFGDPARDTRSPPGKTSVQPASATGEASLGENIWSLLSSFLSGGGGDVGPSVSPTDAANAPPRASGDARAATGAHAQGDVWGSLGDTFPGGRGGTGVGGFVDGLFHRFFSFGADREKELPNGQLDADKEEAPTKEKTDWTKASAEPYLKQVISGGEGASPHLARYLAYRLGVEGFTNSTLAAESLQRAADLGDSNAQMLYANAHMSGVRPSSISAHPSSFFPNGTDVSVALRYYTKAAEQGRFEAIFNVAVLTLHGAGEGTLASTGLSSPTTLDPGPSSSSSSSSFSSSSSSSSFSSSSPPSPSPSLSFPDKLRLRRPFRERCVEAFGLFQKVAFSHPTVGALHALSSYAFSKGDETGALLVSVLLSEIGHAAGHVNAAALWPRLTRKRAELVERLYAAFKAKRGDEETGVLDGQGRRNGRREDETAEERSAGRSAAENCANVSAFAVYGSFFLPQQTYLATPEAAVYHVSDSPVSVSRPPSLPHSSEPRPDGPSGPEDGGGFSLQTCDLSVASNALRVHLHHLRVSEFVRCWARPPGEEWRNQLFERFPFLRRVVPRGATGKEGEGAWDRFSGAETEGDVCAFYFLRRAAVAGDVTSMLEVSRAYLDQAAFFEETQEQVQAAFASRGAAFRSLSVEERIEEMARRTVEGANNSQLASSHEGRQAASPHGEGPSAQAQKGEKGDRESAVPSWVKRLFLDAIDARRRASFVWRSAAGKQKDGRGLLELGEAFEHGQGVRRDRREAYKIYFTMATDPQHTPASRFLGFLALGQATLRWMGRRIGELGVPFHWGLRPPVSGTVSFVARSAAPRTASRGAEASEGDAEDFQEMPREDDDPSPFTCIQEWRASEQRAKEWQNYVWNRLLLVFFLLLVAALLGIVTAMHARGLTASRAPLRAAEHEAENLPFFHMESMESARAARPSPMGTVEAASSAGADSTLSDRREDGRGGERQPSAAFLSQQKGSGSRGRSPSPATSAVSFTDCRMQSSEEEAAGPRNEDVGDKAESVGIVWHRDSDGAASWDAGVGEGAEDRDASELVCGDRVGGTQAGDDDGPSCLRRRIVGRDKESSMQSSA
ncbi:hypothetical protein NCLIV_033410 [Neospora caninum Liverpool]|uniref:Sel1 repeat-containing protein n=1 Tax=Neospora caninum (strain Liverpool) TaxID=572307 RepID=F0VIJ3_NEOCL|nr:hypothetical protein NCLIV_033410 [Neospora caninum Liverpool]CBZ53554.1 hypothetical protein NCLIV_033410 [Neospora caninum Liverpool]CEL67542.1 TPA: Sel1 repeat-containing protein [Neospora caninum Liverpool]|eukprot:XP_003883586.1 hypothetical protein NCLIV_033410 [Neospora caninum Liverpool]